MTRSDPLTDTEGRCLANARRSVLIVLGSCGVAALALAPDEPRPLPGATNSLVTIGVIVLALAAVAARQLAAREARARGRARWLIATYAFSAALGIAGMLLALATGERSRGIAYVLAGAIFALAGTRVGGGIPNRSPR